MFNLQHIFEIALRQHRAGFLAEAEKLYQQILAVAPTEPEALHMLGVVALQTNRPDLAERLLRRCLAIAPNNAKALSNFGHALCEVGRFGEAAAACQSALLLNPAFPQAYYNLAAALVKLGQFHDAIASYQQAIRLKPDFAEAHCNLGIALAMGGRTEEAFSSYRRAIEVNSKLAPAYFNLGNLSRQMGRIDVAINAYRTAIEFSPLYLEAYNNLGNTYRDEGRYEEATQTFQRAIELQPAFALAHCSLGNVFADQGRFDDAADAFRAALQCQPKTPCPLNGLGKALFDQNRREEGLAVASCALSAQPGVAEARFHQAQLLLRVGKFKQAWPLYESRWNLPETPKRAFSEPPWGGGSIEGKRVLIYSEQGFGDSIQFIRYAPLIAARGAEVIVECQKSLLNLFQSVKEIGHVFAAGEPPPPFDLHVAMLSQPLLFNTTLQTIPGEIPYLFADTDLRERWRERLDNRTSSLRVGLVWAGNVDNVSLRKRHLTLERMLPLLAVKNVTFFSMQLGSSSGQPQSISDRVALVDHTAHIQDFADTAAFMAELDLIISVDTAAAHLAGALGRPVWTLLPFIADWRWELARDLTPWYPTMRLFRQPKAGDWDSVIQRAAQELEKLANTLELVKRTEQGR